MPASPLGVQLARLLTDEAQAQAQPRLELAADVVGRDKGTEREGDWPVEVAGLGRAEHGNAPDGELTR